MATKNWEKFEIEATNHLNDTFGNVATFIHHGASDSTCSDIEVIPNNGTDSFYMEAKNCPAQSGQFVLTADMTSHKFNYSARNAMPRISSVDKIVDYMNDNFDSFASAGTSGVEIELDSSIFAEWITTMYAKKKNVKYFITNNYAIVPIEDFDKAFDIKAMFRVKKSGSSSAGKKNFVAISSIIKEQFGIDSNDINIQDSKMFVYGDKNLDKNIFTIQDKRFMFSARDNNDMVNTDKVCYEIRKLSNTNNANVIFSLKNNKDYKAISTSDFANMFN